MSQRHRRAILIAASWISGSAGLFAMNMAVFPLLEAINFGVTMATPSAALPTPPPARGVWLIDATAGYGAVTRRADSGPVPGVAVPDAALPRGRRRATRVFPESDRQSALILPSDPAPPISHRRKDGSRPCAQKSGRTSFPGSASSRQGAHRHSAQVSCPAPGVSSPHNRGEGYQMSAARTSRADPPARQSAP